MPKSIVRILLIVLIMGLVIAPLPARGQDAPYRDASLPVEVRVEDLLGRMTLEEKIGQMTLVEKGSVSPTEVNARLIGGVLSGGGGSPRPNTVEAWAEMVDSYQLSALETRLGIPVLYGVDAVHGHGNLYGATIFPHNIGLGAARNPDLVKTIAHLTAQEMIATGIYWNYAPVVAVTQDIRWGRTYESYSENTALVTELGRAALEGMQGESLAAPLSVLATPKHYVGDGGTAWGTSEFGAMNLDRGATNIDESRLRAIHLPPYLAAIEGGAMSIMASFSSWGGLKMHAQRYLLTTVLKEELGFQGFVVSDWEGIDRVSPSYDESVIAAINAGVDMNMVPQNYPRFIRSLTKAVETGAVPLTRIDDAVRRILRAKISLGLFERPFSNPDLRLAVGSAEHRAVARRAVSESLVLLKNTAGALPLAKTTPTIFVGGVGADDIGLQSGGWTIEWQGKAGAITPGTTILEGIRAAVSPETQVTYNAAGSFEGMAEVGIAVLSEPPYAEWFGDSATLALPADQLAMVEQMRTHSKTLIVILLSGRPLVITDQLLAADVFIAAWLPGTEGDGVTDALFGNAPFTGKLPFTWLRNIDQIPFDFSALTTEGCNTPLFPFGYGLTIEMTTSAEVDRAATCAGVDGTGMNDTGTWELVWSDEFEGEAGTPPNKEFWAFDIGGSGWGNNELQYYTDDIENAALDGEGSLAIVAREENPNNYRCPIVPCKYTSARLITQKKVTVLYGRIEARIKIPRGQGIWPAFWMLGADITKTPWPKCGEIDIMENIGSEPKVIHQTVHGPGYSGANGVTNSYRLETDFADDFHVYAVDWQPDSLRWYIDGVLVRTVTPDDLRGNAWVFDHEFFLLLNVAVGGNWPGKPDKTTIFPQTMLIDYVRVYRQAE